MSPVLGKESSYNGVDGSDEESFIEKVELEADFEIDLVNPEYLSRVSSSQHLNVKSQKIT